MTILILGTDVQVREVRDKFGDQHAYTEWLGAADVAFDFISPMQPEQLRRYDGFQKPIYIDSSLVPLSKSLANFPDLHDRVIGFCGLNGFVNRELLEVTTLSKASETLAAESCKALGTEYRLVADQAGMVSPRMICMIINEAYYTLEEGTATREDIDLAMKLGTNYPAGPFEWSKAIGLTNIVRVLSAAIEETADDRYKVCPMLEQEAKSKN